MIINNNILKDSIREIKSNKKVVLLVIFLISLATSFYVGINMFEKNAKNSVENYYKDTNLMDLKIDSNVGFLENSLLPLKQNKEINGIMLVKSIEGKVNVNNKDYNVKINNISKDRSTKNNDYINRLVLIKGRYPSTVNEGLVEDDFLEENNLQLGSLITISLDDGNLLKAKKIKITGTVKSSYYSSFNNQLNNKSDDNKKSYFVYLDDNDFNFNYYTESYITFKSSYKYDTYKKDYENYIDNNTQSILKEVKKIADERRNFISTNLSDEIATLEINLNEIYSLDIPQESLSKQIKLISEQLIKNKNNLNKINNLNVTALKRTDLPGFINYKEEIKRTQNISKLLAPIFTIIAIFITSYFIIKRINYKKDEIMALKLIGYNNFNILFKYLSYVLLITLIGSILGGLILSKVVCMIIISNINEIYNIPIMIPNVNIKLVIYSFLFNFILTLIFIILYYYLFNKKTPLKNKIKLFNINGRKIKFDIKRKSIFPIIILMFSSILISFPFSIKNICNNTISNQYDKIHKYDLVVNINNNISKEDLDEINNNISLVSKKSIRVNNINKIVSNNNLNNNANIFILENYNKLNDFIKLKNNTNKKIKPQNNGVIITKKLAKNLKLKKDDKILIDGYDKKIKVIDITEDYFNNYIYMTNGFYNSISDEEIKYNTIFIKYDKLNDIKKDIINKLTNNKNIINYSFTDNLKQESKSMINIILRTNTIVSCFIIVFELTIIYIVFNINQKNKKLKLLGINSIKKVVYANNNKVKLIITSIILGILIGGYLARYCLNLCNNNLFIFSYNNFNYNIVLFTLLLVIAAFLIIRVIKHQNNQNKIINK